MSYLKSCQKGEDCVNSLNSAPEFGCFIPDGKCNYCTTMEAYPSKYKGHIDGCGQRYVTTTTKGTTHDDFISCTSARDCEQETALFRKAYGCFDFHGLRICRACDSKGPNDIVDVDGCGGVWNTTSTYHYHGDDTTTGDHDAFDKLFTSLAWIVFLIVLISIIGGVMCCMGCCPGQTRERERPVYNDAVVNAGYAGYPAGYYGGQYVLVPTPYQTQFAVLTSPPPIYIVDKGPKKQKDVTAPKPPPKQNAVSPAPAPVPVAPKSENNAHDDIVIRLKVEVPGKS